MQYQHPTQQQTLLPTGLQTQANFSSSSPSSNAVYSTAHSFQSSSVPSEQGRLLSNDAIHGGGRESYATLNANPESGTVRSNDFIGTIPSSGHSTTNLSVESGPSSMVGQRLDPSQSHGYPPASFSFASSTQLSSSAVSGAVNAGTSPGYAISTPSASFYAQIAPAFSSSQPFLSSSFGVLPTDTATGQHPQSQANVAAPGHQPSFHLQSQSSVGEIFPSHHHVFVPASNPLQSAPLPQQKQSMPSSHDPTGLNIDVQLPGLTAYAQPSTRSLGSYPNLSPVSTPTSDASISHSHSSNPMNMQQSRMQPTSGVTTATGSTTASVSLATVASSKSPRQGNNVHNRSHPTTSSQEPTQPPTSTRHTGGPVSRHFTFATPLAGQDSSSGNPSGTLYHSATSPVGQGLPPLYGATYQRPNGFQTQGSFPVPSPSNASFGSPAIQSSSSAFHHSPRAQLSPGASFQHYHAVSNQSKQGPGAHMLPPSPRMLHGARTSTDPHHGPSQTKATTPRNGRQGGPASHQSHGAQSRSQPTPSPTHTGFRSLKAKFIRDVTLPDRCRVSPNCEYYKTWEVANAGVQPWPVELGLVFMRGEAKCVDWVSFSDPFDPASTTDKVPATTPAPSSASIEGKMNTVAAPTSSSTPDVTAATTTNACSPRVTLPSDTVAAPELKSPVAALETPTLVVSASLTPSAGLASPSPSQIQYGLISPVTTVTNQSTSPTPSTTAIPLVVCRPLTKPVLPGQAIHVTARLVTPNTPGRCMAVFRLTDPSGAPFGPRMWVDLLNGDFDNDHAKKPENDGAVTSNPQPGSSAADSVEPDPAPTGASNPSDCPEPNETVKSSDDSGSSAGRSALRLKRPPPLTNVESFDDLCEPITITEGFPVAEYEECDPEGARTAQLSEQVAPTATTMTESSNVDVSTRSASTGLCNQPSILDPVLAGPEQTSASQPESAATENESRNVAIAAESKESDIQSVNATEDGLDPGVEPCVTIQPISEQSNVPEISALTQMATTESDAADVPVAGAVSLESQEPNEAIQDAPQERLSSSRRRRRRRQILSMARALAAAQAAAAAAASSATPSEGASESTISQTLGAGSPKPFYPLQTESVGSPCLHTPIQPELTSPLCVTKPNERRHVRNRSHQLQSSSSFAATAAVSQLQSQTQSRASATPTQSARTGVYVQDVPDRSRAQLLGPSKTFDSDFATYTTGVLRGDDDDMLVEAYRAATPGTTSLSGSCTMSTSASTSLNGSNAATILMTQSSVRLGSSPKIKPNDPSFALGQRLTDRGLEQPQNQDGQAAGFAYGGRVQHPPRPGQVPSEVQLTGLQQQQPHHTLQSLGKLSGQVSQTSVPELLTSKSPNPPHQLTLLSTDPSSGVTAQTIARGDAKVGHQHGGHHNRSSSCALSSFSSQVSDARGSPVVEPNSSAVVPVRYASDDPVGFYTAPVDHHAGQSSLDLKSSSPNPLSFENPPALANPISGLATNEDGASKSFLTQQMLAPNFAQTHGVAQPTWDSQNPVLSPGSQQVLRPSTETNPPYDFPRQSSSSSMTTTTGMISCQSSFNATTATSWPSGEIEDTYPQNLYHQGQGHGAVLPSAHSQQKPQTPTVFYSKQMQVQPQQAQAALQTQHYMQPSAQPTPPAHAQVRSTLNQQPVNVPRPSHFPPRPETLSRQTQINHNYRQAQQGLPPQGAPVVDSQSHLATSAQPNSFLQMQCRPQTRRAGQQMQSHVYSLAPAAEPTALTMTEGGQHHAAPMQEFAQPAPGIYLAQQAHSRPNCDTAYEGVPSFGSNFQMDTNQVAIRGQQVQQNPAGVPPTTIQHYQPQVHQSHHDVFVPQSRQAGSVPQTSVRQPIGPQEMPTRFVLPAAQPLLAVLSSQIPQQSRQQLHAPHAHESIPSQFMPPHHTDMKHHEHATSPDYGFQTADARFGAPTQNPSLNQFSQSALPFSAPTQPNESQRAMYTQQSQLHDAYEQASHAVRLRQPASLQHNQQPFEPRHHHPHSQLYHQHQISQPQQHQQPDQLSEPTQSSNALKLPQQGQFAGQTTYDPNVVNRTHSRFNFSSNYGFYSEASHVSNDSRDGRM